MNINRIATTSILTLGVVLFTGCAADGSRAVADNVRTELIPSAALVLDPPAVREADGTLHVSGDVRRPDFAPFRSGGHVHVAIADSAGGILSSAEAQIDTPPGRSTPRTPEPRFAGYHAHLPGPLPEGATLRITACADDHQPADTLE